MSRNKRYPGMEWDDLGEGASRVDLVDNIVTQARVAGRDRGHSMSFWQENFGSAARDILSGLPEADLKRVVSSLQEKFLEKLSLALAAFGDRATDVESVRGWKSAFTGISEERALVLQNAAIVYARTLKVDPEKLAAATQELHARLEAAKSVAREIVSNPAVGDTVRWSSGMYKVNRIENGKIEYRYTNTVHSDRS